MEEKSLVPRPKPEIDRETDPLAGTKAGVAERTECETKLMLSMRNNCDDLDAIETAASNLLWEITSNFPTTAELEIQRTAAWDVEPKRIPNDD